MSEKITKGCKSCHDCRVVTVTNEWKFYGCYHKPYIGKWVAEIEKCPKEDLKNAQ